MINLYTQRTIIRFFTLVVFTTTIFFGCSSDDDDRTIKGVEVSTRYKEPKYSDIKKHTVDFTGDGSLQMDIYSPEDDDSEERAVILLAHGGSFIGGTRDMADMERMCETFAKHGYVAASMSYRLGPGFQIFFDSLEVLNVVVKAVHDGKAAVRYLRKSYVEDGNPFRIDTNHIFGGGNSAGAILMLHLAYMRNPNNIPSHIMTLLNNEGGLEGTRGNENYSSHVHAVINLAGAINQLEYIDHVQSIPIVSAHGDEDRTVPFNCGPVLSTLPAPEFRNRLCGSGPIHQRTDLFNIPNKLLVFEGDDHCPWIGSNGQPTEKMDEVEKTIIDFLYRQFFRTVI